MEWKEIEGQITVRKYNEMQSEIQCNWIGKLLQQTQALLPLLISSLTSFDTDLLILFAPNVKTISFTFIKFSI
jgi:hypothetical protein